MRRDDRLEVIGDRIWEWGWRNLRCQNYPKISKPQNLPIQFLVPPLFQPFFPFSYVSFFLIPRMDASFSKIDQALGLHPLPPEDSKASRNWSSCSSPRSCFCATSTTWNTWNTWNAMTRWRCRASLSFELEGWNWYNLINYIYMYNQIEKYKHWMRGCYCICIMCIQPHRSNMAAPFRWAWNLWGPLQRHLSGTFGAPTKTNQKLPKIAKWW